MDELQRWLDMAPTLRGAQITWGNGGWSSRVWVEDSHTTVRCDGHGVSSSLTFAVVAAILDFRKNQEG